MFEIISQKNNRRIGKIETKHGVINTPFFMPDATRGFVKSLGKADLEKIGYNNSMVHSDFMFGSEDMEITGLTQDGQIVKLFEKGNFII